MNESRMINTKCHGCSTPMVFEASPFKIVEWSGETKTYWGKDDAIWICKTCREDPKKLKAARIATGFLPQEANISKYDETEDSQSSPEAGA